MNDTVYLDAPFDDDERRKRLYEGQILVYPPRPSSLALCAFARGLIEEAFAPLDPRKAQHDLEVGRYAEILNGLKPAFIHHPESKRHVRAMLSDFGCDATKTYFDVPRMRSSTSDGYLTTGIAYAWHPHRDTWYSAPPCQLNWWTPIYDIVSENAMAFHPRYFSEGVANTSAEYNYYEWNKVHRGSHVGTYTKEDPRPLPRSVQPIELNPQFASSGSGGQGPLPYFRRADALERPQHLRRHPVQHRLSDGESGRRQREARRRKRGLAVHRHHDA